VTGGTCEMIWRRKPKLEPLAADDVALYSTDQLRAAYHHAVGSHSELVRLRNCNVTQTELVQEIRYRVAVEDRRFQLIACLTFIAAIASVAAALLALLDWLRS
jgi:hypothetical protein